MDRKHIRPSVKTRGNIMNRKKKLISVILVLAMLISSFAVTMPVAAAESASVGNTTENTATKTATVLGDMNSDGEVNTDDAIYLLRHVLMSSKYPISQSGDVNGDDEVNTDDAIYLLRHVLMPSKYPILSACEHSVVTDVGIAPTCTEKGLSEGSHCEKCGEVFVAQQVLSATGHEYIFNSEIEAPDGEDAYKCEYCGDIKYVAEEDGISAVYAEDSREFDRTPDFTFDIIYDGDKEYIYENLSLVNEILDDAGLEANVEYTLTDLGNGVWRVSPKENYREYVTYYAKLGGNLKFKDYNGTKLTFDIYGEEKSEVSFNEGIIFLKKLESDNTGYFPYTLTFNEQTELFTLVLSKVGTFTQEHVGKIMCIGDYSSAEEILSDATKECTFGKIKSVTTNNDGTCTIVLEAPQISEVFKELDISTSQSVLFNEEMFDESFDSYVIESFTQSEGFAEFAASATLAAESYASDNGLMLAAKKDSILDHIKFKDITPQISDDYKTITVTVGGDLVYDLEKNGKAYGSLKVGFEAVFTINFDFFVDYTKGAWDLPNFERMEIRIDQTTAFDFHFYVTLDVDVHSEKLYVVNVNSLKIHKEDCRILDNTNSKNLVKYNGEELKAFFESKGKDILANECKVCQSISQYDGSLYILNINNNINTLHCQDCFHTKNLKNVTYVFEIPSGVKYCGDCNPQTRFIPDFADRMLNSMKSSNWSKTIDKIKEEVKKGNLENDNTLSKDIKEWQVPLGPAGIFTAKFDLDFEFSFVLDINLDYEFDYSVTNQYGLIITVFEDEKIKTYIKNGNPEVHQMLHLIGSARAEAGVILYADISVAGMNEWMNIGLNARVGAYAELAGVLHFEDNLEDGKYYENDYAAAYFEMGIYCTIQGKAKFPNVDEEKLKTDVYGGDVPIFTAGYDKVYHSFVEYEKTIEVSDGTNLNDVDLLMVKYLDLRTMDEDIAELDAAGKSGKYTVRYEFYNTDGTQNKYFSVKNGVINIADGAPEEFTVTMYVYVEGIDDGIETFVDFLKNKFEKGNSVYSLGEYEIVVTNMGDSEGLEYTLSDDGKYYIVAGKGSCESYHIVIPETYKDLPVKEIAEKAFYGSNIKSVTIPASVTKIGNYAFAKSKSLTQVNTAEGLLEIGTAAFEDCTALKEITIPNTVKTIGVQAFYKCSSITEITIPNGVTTIGFCMFAECSELETIDLPNTLTYIGERAFENCPPLDIEFHGTIAEWSAINKHQNWQPDVCFISYLGEETGKPVSEGLEYKLSDDGKYYIVAGIGTCTDKDIVIPEKYNNLPVKEIGQSAFRKETTITSITIPDSITNIGNLAFQMCTSLASVSIPDSVTSIGDFAFQYCECLTSVTIPYSVTSIGNNVFAACVNLASVIIPNSVTSINSNAFYNCISLTSVNIPDSVVSIGDFAFGSCSSLTTIEIPDSVKSIGNMVLYNCTSLTTINFLGTETEWNAITKGSRWDANTGDYTVVFESETNGSKGLAYTLSSDGTYYSVSSIGTCTDTDIVIPATYNGLPVSDIGGRAFYECKNLRSVTMPNSVMSIGDEAFYYCTSLTSVTIPNSVTNIGDVAFCGCGNLTSVTIPDSVTSIGTSAFGYCGSLTNIFVEENNINYKSLNGNLYSKDGKMLILYAIGKKETSFIIPSSVTTIGYAAFSGCTSLINITIPNSVTIIGESAFNACKGLVNVTIPDSVTQIFNYAFSGCTSLTSVTIPDSVIGLGFCVFYCCTSLASVTIPDSVTSIGSMVFGYCRGLTSVTMPRSVTWIGSSMFYECNSLTSVTIPDSVSSIDSEAFYNCTNLTKIVFEGTRSQWEAINKDADWDKNAGAFTVKCTDGDIVADGEEIPVISITLSETQVILTVGSSQYIEVSVYPENATNQRITWTTGSFSVADIAWSGENNYRGLIVANSEGTTVITASTADGKVLAQCRVIVYVA